MSIRAFRPGDEAARAELFNRAAGELPGFKPAVAADVARRTTAADFDPATVLFAEDGGRIVGYVTLADTGRVGHPWCLPGHEAHIDSLLTAALDALRARGVGKAWAAYRADWSAVAATFARHGFAKVRDVVNYILDVSEMPTLAFKPATPIMPMRPEDVPAVAELGAGVIRSANPEVLRKHLFENPHFGPESLFVMKGRDGSVLAAGVLIENAAFADPKAIDPTQPCFRHGAFGTEGLTTKRVTGLFSVLVRADNAVMPRMLDLLGYAAGQLELPSTHRLAAQVPSDAPHLVTAHERFFRRQATFPVFEKGL